MRTLAIIAAFIVTVAAVAAVEPVRQSAVSPSEKRLIQREYIRARVDELSSISLEQLRQRIETRTVEHRERRIAMVPCVYRDQLGKLLTWGLDLPQPDRDWVTIEKATTATTSTGGTILRFVESTEHQCWCAVVFDPKWLIVPPHGTVTCLTNLVAMVAVPESEKTKAE